MLLIYFLFLIKMTYLSNSRKGVTTFYPNLQGAGGDPPAYLKFLQFLKSLKLICAKPFFTGYFEKCQNRKFLKIFDFSRFSARVFRPP